MRRATSAVGLAGLLLACGCRTVEPGPEPGIETRSDARIETVEAFRAARDAGDLERAAGYLSADPRRWWEEREGAGAPWGLATGGPWKGWDEHFRGRSEQRTPWEVAGDAVWADMYEVNDFYLLVERGGGWWRATYFFDEDDRIAGFMVSVVPGKETPPGRREEFEAWAFAHHPDEAEYLMPGGSLDPSGDRPARMRALLDVWRESEGLAPIP